jgi:hypothetical protein
MKEIKNKKDHCTNGHEYTVENTYIDTRGYRKCKVCVRIRAKRDYASLKQDIKEKRTQWK